MTSLKYSQESESNPQNNFSRVKEAYFVKELLKRLDKYDDDSEVTLQDSIPIFYELNIFQELTSIPDAKKRLTQNSKPNNRLQLQARFIYNLWKIISQEQIPMSFFKQIITLFMTEQIADITIKLDQRFQDEDNTIVELLAIWQGMLQKKSHQSSYQQFKDSSVLTQQGINMSEFNHYHNQSSPQNNSSASRYSNSRNNDRVSKTKRQKQNQKQQISRNSKPYTDRYQTRKQTIEDVRDQIYSNLYEIPVMSVERQKELVNRLYVVNKYDKYQELKKMQDQEKLMKEMELCTFKPNIQKRIKCQSSNKYRTAKTQNKTIPGFQKAIERMKVGQQKAKQLKQKLELRNIHVTPSVKQQNQKTMIPPKFLTRQQQKQQKKVLFTIQFDIGRHKLTCKIHENDSAQQLARNIQSIYSLKQDSFEEIKKIIQQQIQRYMILCAENQNERNQGNQNDENYEQFYEGGQNQIEQGTQQSKSKRQFVFC